MCINCNLPNPLFDEVCEDLGIEKGKYLAPSHYITSMYLNEKSNKLDCCNMAVNFTNIKNFNYNIVPEKEITLRSGNKVQLYTGKIEQKEDSLEKYTYDINEKNPHHSFDKRFHILKT